MNEPSIDSPAADVKEQVVGVSMPQTMEGHEMEDTFRIIEPHNEPRMQEAAEANRQASKTRNVLVPRASRLWVTLASDRQPIHARFSPSVSIIEADSDVRMGLSLLYHVIFTFT